MTFYFRLQRCFNTCAHTKCKQSTRTDGDWRAFVWVLCFGWRGTFPSLCAAFDHLNKRTIHTRFCGFSPRTIGISSENHKSYSSKITKATTRPIEKKTHANSLNLCEIIKHYTITKKIKNCASWLWHSMILRRTLTRNIVNWHEKWTRKMLTIWLYRWLYKGQEHLVNLRYTIR